MVDRGAPLRERDAELRAIADSLDGLVAGRPGVLIIQGPAGIGKTSLVAALDAHARAAGLRVLRARGSELEGDFAFGVAGQLLEPLVFGADSEDLERWFAGPAAAARPLFDPELAREAVVDDAVRQYRRHGLFWLVANLSRERPLLIAVDDAQWADDASAEFLRHLATRLDRLPVLLAIASRPSDGPLRRLAAEPGTRVLRPARLSEGAVAAWVAEAFEAAGDDSFTAAVLRATRGNPFLVGELMREVRAQGMKPGREASERVRTLSPRRVTTAVVERLESLPPEAGALARALAVLGEAGVEVVAGVAGQPPEVAAAAATALVRADIVADRRTAQQDVGAATPGRRATDVPSGDAPIAVPGDDVHRLKFAHPLVRTALYDDIPAPERRIAHGHAARALHRTGARPEQVAAQLLLAAPIREEPWALATLAGAAREAVTRGAPEVAARLLARALLETDDPDVRCELLLALGRAEVLARRPDAVHHLREAVRLARTPAQRVAATVTLSRVLRFASAGGEAVELLEEVGAGLQDDTLRLRIELELLASTTVSHEARRRVGAPGERWPQPPDGDPDGFFARFLHAAHAVEAAGQGRDATRVLELAKAGVAVDPGPTHLGRHVRLLAAYAFLLSDRYDLVEQQLAVLADVAAARGGAELAASVEAQRAFLAYRRGHLDDVSRHALAALEQTHETGPPSAYLLPAVAGLIWVAIGTGEPPHPLAAVTPDDGDSLFGRHLDFARAVLAVNQGDPERGLALLRAAGERELTLGWSGPAPLAWRSQAALALDALGRRDEARELAGEELRLAEAYGSPRSIGIAGRTGALLTDDAAAQIAGLERAVEALARSGAELEHARGLVELGIALRRERGPEAARSPLRAAYDLAARCGATAVAARAHKELLAAGARPRRAATSGDESLTERERAVAELAAAGATNRGIAEALFVSEKTVETHLRHVFRKLGVASRRALPEVLP